MSASKIEDEQQVVETHETEHGGVGAAAVAGACAGVLVSGPAVGIVAGAVLANAAAHSDDSPLGEVAHAAGDVVMDAVHKAQEVHLGEKVGHAVAVGAEKAKEYNREHHVTERVAEAASHAIEDAKEYNREHHVVERAKETAVLALEDAKEYNREHHVVEKAKIAAINAIQWVVRFEKEHHIVEKVVAKTGQIAKMGIEKIQECNRKDTTIE